MVNPWPTPYDQHGHVRCLYTLQPLMEKGHTSCLRSPPHRTPTVLLVSGKPQLNRTKTLPSKAAPVRGAQLLDTTFRLSGTPWNTRTHSLVVV